MTGNHSAEVNQFQLETHLDEVSQIMRGNLGREVNHPKVENH